MVRKVSVLLAVLVLIFALGISAQAATHSIYNGNISSTYTTYFKDILSGVSFKDNYVAFRADQNQYIMVTGYITYTENNNTFTLNGEGRFYVFDTASTSGYNSRYTYDTYSSSNFSLTADDNIIYSDLGHYPQLMERGAKYEMLSAVLLCVALLGIVIRSFFRSR